MSDTAVRQSIDPIAPIALKTILAQPVRLLLQEGVLKPYEFLKQYWLIAIDGSSYFSSPSIHCSKCCERHHRDSTTTYYHNALCAVLIKPKEHEVFPIAMEEITRQGVKNDCALSAVRRLLPQLPKALPGCKLAVSEDALFCNAPPIKELQHLDIRRVYSY
jgi:hypothetical protein